MAAAAESSPLRRAHTVGDAPKLRIKVPGLLRSRSVTEASVRGAIPGIARRALAAIPEEAAAASAGGKPEKAQRVAIKRSFNTLPDEILQKIIRTLSPISLTTLGGASTGLAAITRSLREDIGCIPRDFIEWAGGTDRYLAMPKLDIPCTASQDPMSEFIGYAEGIWVHQQVMAHLTSLAAAIPSKKDNATLTAFVHTQRGALRTLTQLLPESSAKGAEMLCESIKALRDSSTGDTPKAPLLEAVNAAAALFRKEVEPTLAGVPPLCTKEAPFVRGECLQDGTRTILFGIPVQSLYTSSPAMPDWGSLEDEEEPDHPVTLTRTLYVVEFTEEGLSISNGWNCFDRFILRTSWGHDDFPDADAILRKLLPPFKAFLIKGEEASASIHPANQLGNVETYTLIPGWQ